VINENVLVVSRQEILPPIGKAFYGISAEALSPIMDAISKHGFFMDRATAEHDERFKQIIPYFIFHTDEKLFLMQRAASANETRLASKMTLGIGGHIRSEDTKSTPTIFEWGLREFREEVCYAGILDGELLGFINDDTNAVGRVHMGVVFLVHGDSADISIRSELASGELMNFAQCCSCMSEMESWSSLVMEHLIQRRAKYGSIAGNRSSEICSITRVQI